MDISKLYYDWLTDKIATDDSIGDYTPICNHNYLPYDCVRDIPAGREVRVVDLDYALGQPDPAEKADVPDG